MLFVINTISKEKSLTLYDWVYIPLFLPLLPCQMFCRAIMLCNEIFFPCITDMTYLRRLLLIPRCNPHEQKYFFNNFDEKDIVYCLQTSEQNSESLKTHSEADDNYGTEQWESNVLFSDHVTRVLLLTALQPSIQSKTVANGHQFFAFFFDVNSSETNILN